MKTYRNIGQLKKAIKKIKAQGLSIGFVPTMGNLHEGHLALLRSAVKENGAAVLSIYVNPTQFGPKEDYSKYPRTLKEDLKLAKNEGCKIAFLPENETMYPPDFSTYVNEEKLSIPMCGARRPGHFRGVATVVCKLFNIVEPDISYFGQKDAQQALVMKRMVRDLNFSTQIRILATVREKSGLALSSRNNYLKAQDRERASIIYRSLQEAEKAFFAGERRAKSVKRLIERTLRAEPEISVDYVDIRSCETLETSDKIEGKTLIAVSASYKGVHLIDNIMLG